MENLNFIEQLKALTETEDLLSVGRDVNELRSKFDDYILEEERKVQIAELQASGEGVELPEGGSEAQIEIESVEELTSELTQLKDDFFEIYKSFQERKKIVADERKDLEKKNLGEKNALIARLKDVVTKEENIGAAFSALKEIQDQWKEVGDIPRDKRNDVQSEYSKLLEDFFYNIKIYKDLKDHDFHRNLQLKTALIGELKKLNTLKSMKEMETQLKSLQNEWDDIGPIPNAEWDKMKEAYWTEVRSIYEKINRFYDDRRVLLQNNLKEKQAVLDQVQSIVTEIEGLNDVKAWDDATKTILEIQAKWKTIGFGPKKENDAIWKLFRKTCDAFFNAKKEFFGTVNEQFDAIADKKKALIAKAKELKVSTDWKETANALKNLQQQWKTLGHSGGKNEQKLWKEFRGACDGFFTAREAFFGEKDKQLENNLVLKNDLLKELVEYKPVADKKQALADLKKFSADFNAIGHVPLKQKDGIFKAFKKAMDDHYGALKMEGSEKEAILFEAKIEMLKSSPNASRLIDDMKFELRKEIDKHTKEITQLENNLGFFANSKGADALKKEVEKKVDRVKEKIEEIKAKLKMIPRE